MALRLLSVPPAAAGSTRACTWPPFPPPPLPDTHHAHTLWAAKPELLSFIKGLEDASKLLGLQTGPQKAGGRRQRVAMHSVHSRWARRQAANARTCTCRAAGQAGAGEAPAAGTWAPTCMRKWGSGEYGCPASWHRIQEAAARPKMEGVVPSTGMVPTRKLGTTCLPGGRVGGGASEVGGAGGRSKGDANAGEGPRRGSQRSATQRAHMPCARPCSALLHMPGNPAD